MNIMQAREEGRRAYSKGQVKIDNPYGYSTTPGLETDCHIAWERGFLIAAADDGRTIECGIVIPESLL